MIRCTSAKSPARTSPASRRLALLPVAGLIVGLLAGPVYAGAAPSGTQQPAAAASTVKSGPLTAVVGNGTATLKWTGVTGATGYVVGRNGTDATGYGAWATTDPASARSRTFNKLVNGRTYTLSVQSRPGGVKHTIKVTPRVATPAPTPTPTAAPVATIVGDGTATLTWAGVTGATGYLVGRNGVDATGYGAWATTDPSTARSRVFKHLVNGRTYTFSVQAQPRGVRHTVRVTPHASTTTPTPPSTAGKVPLIGKSKLPFNSVVFGHGANPSSFESWRNRPVDGVLYFPARHQWADMGQLPSRRAGDLMIYSIPPFPQNIGGSNAKVATGQYDTEIRALAARMKAAGWNTNRTVIRLGWENNGSWYQWGQDRGGAEAFKASYRRFVTQSRAAGLTNVKWDWNLNKGPQAYNAGVSWTTGYPGDDVVDVIGIDAYDMWNPSFTDAQWEANMMRRNPGLQEVADFARARKKQIALDEWGVVHDTHGGGDNPFYIAKMFGFVKANADIMAWENTYDDDGAPSTFKHKLSNGQNPRAAAQYRRAFPDGWGG